MIQTIRDDGWTGENGGASQSGGLATPDIATAPATRHDGWTGERIAGFCEILAETAVVAEACEAVGMSIGGAYAARRRNPLFAAAWEASLGIARERLADTLLARAMEGNVEQIYRGGELIGERHFLDNRLGLQILRRLDHLADLPGAGRAPGAARPRSRALQPVDWSFALEALRSGDDEGVARALALVDEPALEAAEVHEVEEVEGAPNPLLCALDDPFYDIAERCQRDVLDQTRWVTDFPPPEGFSGWESRPYDADDGDEYERECTAEEIAILEAEAARARSVVRAEDEELRDAWFDYLRAACSTYEDEADGMLAAPGEDDRPGPAGTKPAAPPG